MRNRMEPYRFASCLSMIVLDWLVYAATMTMHRSWSSAWLLSTVIGSAVAFVAVAGMESRALGEPKHSLYRGLVAALIVATPLPVLGTAVGVGCMIWTLAASRARSGTS